MFVLNEMSKNYDYLKKIEHLLKKRFDDLSYPYDVEYLITTRNVLNFSQDIVTIYNLTGIAYISQRTSSFDVLNVFNDDGNLLNIYYSKHDESDDKLIYIKLDDKVLLDLFFKKLRFYFLSKKEKEQNTFFKKLFKKNKEDYKEEIQEELVYLKNEFKKISEIIYNISFLFSEFTIRESERQKFYVYSNFSLKNIHSFLDENCSSNYNFEEDIKSQFDFYQLEKSENAIVDLFLENTKSYKDIYFHIDGNINDLFEDEEDEHLSDKAVISRKITLFDSVDNKISEKILLKEEHFKTSSFTSSSKTTYNYLKSFIFILERHYAFLKRNQFKLNVQTSWELNDLLKNESINEDISLFLKNIDKDDYIQRVLIEENEYGDLLLDFFKALKEQGNFSAISNFYLSCNKNSIFHQLNYLSYLSLFDEYFNSKDFQIKFINKYLISISYIDYHNEFDLIYINLKKKIIIFKDLYLIENNIKYKDVFTKIQSLLTDIFKLFTDFKLQTNDLCKINEFYSYKELQKNSFSLLIEK